MNAHVTLRVWIYWQQPGFESLKYTDWLRGGGVKAMPLMGWLPRYGSVVCWEISEQKHKERWWLEGINERTPPRRRIW